jgi:pimeloyl-ACP methyl ester carboxylesterase
MKYLDLHGDRVAYREAGAGEALLLIHGMAGSSATWRAVLPQLPKKYRVVAPDLFGQGPKRNIWTWLETKPDILKRASGCRIADLSAVLVIQGVRCAIANTPKLRRGLLAAEEKPPSTAPSWTRRRTNTSGSESPTCMRSAGLEAG